MNSAKLHIGEMETKNILQYIQCPSKYKEQLKGAEELISRLRDSYEKTTGPTEMVCDCYPNYKVCKGMPKSILADKFGYGMQKDIAVHMGDLYAGKLSQEEINAYFEECCTAMLKYRVQQRQTSGTNEEDNTQIVSELYEIFAKENQRAARHANYMEGEKINASYGGREDDWTYYNADYHYQCEDVKSELRQAAQNMSDKWEIAPVDADEIEKNSLYTLDGGFDFNSGWNFTYRNQVGRGSMADESMIPPRDFKFFYNSNMYPDPSIDKGLVRVWLGDKEFSRKVPFEMSRTGGLEGQIFNVGELLQGYLSKSDSNREYGRFLSNFSVFTAVYAWKSGISDIFGNHYI